MSNIICGYRVRENNDVIYRLMADTDAGLTFCVPDGVQEPGYTDDITHIGDNVLKHTIELLAWNYNLLQENKSRIMKDKLLACAYIHTAYAGGSMIGSVSLPLGVLMQLWEIPEWQATCTECGATGYKINWGGQIFSGHNQWFGFCPKCSSIIKGSEQGFVSRVVKARHMASEFRNTYFPKPKEPEEPIPEQPPLSFAELSKKWSDTKYEEVSEKQIEEKIKEQKIEDNTWYSTLKLVVDILNNSATILKD